MKGHFNIQNSSVIYNIATTKNKNHMIFLNMNVVKAFDSLQQAFITKNLNRLGIISPYEDQYLKS